MADINEEQLLSGLLRDLGAADEQMRAPDLEARVLKAWDADHEKGYGPFRTPFSRTAYILGIAAMVTLAVMVTLWTFAPAFAPEQPSATAGKPAASASAAAPLPPAREALRRTGRRDKPVASSAPVAPVALVAPVAPVAPVASDASTSARRATVDKPVASASAPSATADKPVAFEFMPLVPMSEQELTGSFQIVRVQMPRASLGALTSPIHHPSELVEADVLLGEDGMARAIHISTNGSVYPWRPR